MFKWIMTFFSLIWVPGWAFAFQSDQYILNIDPSHYYDISVQLNDQPIDLKFLRQEKQQQYNISNMLNVEINSIKVCFEHKNFHGRKPNLKQLARIELKKNIAQGTSVISKRVLRKISSPGDEHSPGQVECEKLYFSSLSKEELKTSLDASRKAKSRQPSSFISIQ